MTLRDSVIGLLMAILISYLSIYDTESLRHIHDESQGPLLILSLSGFMCFSSYIKNDTTPIPKKGVGVCSTYKGSGFIIGFRDNAVPRQTRRVI